MSLDYPTPVDISPSLLSTHTTQCVVALTDQWYLSYGDPEWVDKVSKHIHSSEFNGYNDKIMESFDHVRTEYYSTYPIHSHLILTLQFP